MLRFKFDPDKAIAALLYISRKLLERHQVKPTVRPDIHRISKILYFADQKHLSKYGRPILGDYFVAMNDGPVPSQIYDMVKAVRGDSYFCSADAYAQYFDVKGYLIYPKQDPDLDQFSESDLQCINESTIENQDLTFDELKAKSHDAAYEKADRNDRISFRRMAEAAGADEAMLNYITTVWQNQNRRYGR